MTFFDKKKPNDKEKSVSDAGKGKNSFSLFHTKTPESPDPAPESRFLTLIRSKEPNSLNSASPQAIEPKLGADSANPELAKPDSVAPAKGAGLSFKNKAVSTETIAPGKTRAVADLPPAVSERDSPALDVGSIPSDVQIDKAKLQGAGLKGLFTFKKQVKKENHAAEKTPLAKKENSNKKAKEPLAAESHVYVQLENGKEFIWAVTDSHLQEVDPSQVTKAVSFSKEDHAIKVEKALSFSAAENLALQEIGEPVHLVNRTTDLSTIYATLEERALSSSYRLYPGQQAVDALVNKVHTKGRAAITGFVFKSREGKIALCVLFYINADGLSTKPQVTLNPDNLDFVLTQFALTRKLNIKDIDKFLFSNAEFLSQVNSLKAYPNERVWQGLPLSLITNFVSLSVAVGATLLAGWAGVNYYQVSQLTSQIETLNTKETLEHKNASASIGKSLYNFAALMSLNDKRAFGLAQSMWQPGGHLVMTSDLTRDKYEIKVPIVTKKTVITQGGGEVTSSPEAVKKSLNFKPPSGCVKENTSVTGNLNEIQITVVCKSPDSILSGFRND